MNIELKTKNAQFMSGIQLDPGKNTVNAKDLELLEKDRWFQKLVDRGHIIVGSQKAEPKKEEESKPQKKKRAKSVDVEVKKE